MEKGGDEEMVPIQKKENISLREMKRKGEREMGEA